MKDRKRPRKHIVRYREGDFKYDDHTLQQLRLKLLTLPKKPATQKMRRRLYMELARVYWKRHEFDESMNVWFQALELGKEEGDKFFQGLVYTFLSSTSFHKGEYDTAIEYAKMALKVAPNETVVLFNMGNAYEEAGEHEKAFEWWEKTIASDPEHSMVVEQVGRLHGRLCNFEKAEEYLFKALELDPESHGTLNELGMIYIILKRYQDAIRYLNKALNLYPEISVTYNNMGNCYLKMGKPDRAKRYYERCLRVSPKDSISAHIGLGLIYRQVPSEKAHLKSRKYFEQALEVYESGMAILLGPRLDHEARRAIALTGLEDPQVIHLWQEILAQPKLNNVGPGPLTDWLFWMESLAQCPNPFSDIEEIVAMVREKQLI